MSKPYQRVLLKLSGEALSKDGALGLNSGIVHEIAAKVADAAQSGVQLSLVIGGGNFWRYRAKKVRALDRATSDMMGMLATVMNAIALQNAIEQAGVPARVQTSINMPEVAEPYIRRKAIRHLEKGRVVIFAGGMGAPYFTTDSAAALRALEIDAQVILKATKVDGVYDSDPEIHKNAKKFESISYNDVLTKELGVMDATAISLCRDNKLPIIVFNVREPDTLKSAIAGKKVGTIVGV